MEKEIIEKIKKEFNWYEKILLKVLTSSYIKTYHIARIETVNYILKK